MIFDTDMVALMLVLFWMGGLLLMVYFAQKNPPRTWRGDPFKWLFVWGYREKYLREHGDQINQVKNPTA